MEDKSEIFFEHGGDLEKAAAFAGAAPGEILDFSNLLNPAGTPPGLADHLKAGLSQAFLHPSSGESLRLALAEREGMSPDRLLIGAGTTEFIRSLPWILKPQRPLILGPTYGDYELALRAAGCSPQVLLAREEEEWVLSQEEWKRAFQTKPDWVIFARPNNPLGLPSSLEILARTIEKNPNTFFIADETCLGISDNPADSFLRLPLGENTVVLRSFSKTYAVPGLRLGFLAGAPSLVEKLRKAQAPWSVSPLALEAGLYLLGREKWLSESHLKNIQEKNRIYSKLSALKNFRAFPSAITAFTLKGTTPSFSSQDLLKRLLKEDKILVRSLSRHPGLGDAYFRIGLRGPEENNRLVRILQEWDGS